MRQVSTTFGRVRDEYLLLDASEIGAAFSSFNAARWNNYSPADWMGGQSTSEALRRTVTGDESFVAPSDKMMTALEDQIVFSKKWRVVEDVVGSLPNVPAYLAGQPNAMRRRTKIDRDDAPLSIFIDLTSSGGINAKDVLRRGVTILTLARLLIEHRAVTLWAGIALGGPMSSTVAWQIDTAPLDLARAAHMLCSPAISRGVGYQLSYAAHSSTGYWPFGDYEKHKRTAKERLQAVLGQELCYVPPIYLTDALVTDSVGWIKRELRVYTGQSEEN